VLHDSVITDYNTMLSVHRSQLDYYNQWNQREWPSYERKRTRRRRPTDYQYMALCVSVIEAAWRVGIHEGVICMFDCLRVFII
jgi:hypothetical protein